MHLYCSIGNSCNLNGFASHQLAMALGIFTVSCFESRGIMPLEQWWTRGSLVDVSTIAFKVSTSCRI